MTLSRRRFLKILVATGMTLLGLPVVSEAREVIDAGSVIITPRTDNPEIKYGETHSERDLSQILEEGLEYKIFSAPENPLGGDSLIRALVIDPEKFRLEFITAFQYKDYPRTTQQWTRKYDLIAAINAGMFQARSFRNCGYAKNYSHINNPRWNLGNLDKRKDYLSALVFNPTKESSPLVRIIDLDKEDPKRVEEEYHTIVQNIRMIDCKGRNRWGKQGNERWSQAAVGIDKDGKLIFLFSESPYTVYEFNQRVLSQFPHMKGMMHCEGGPEASLSINHPDLNINVYGFYERNKRELINVQRGIGSPIPNVIGIIRR